MCSLYREVWSYALSFWSFALSHGQHASVLISHASFFLATVAKKRFLFSLRTFMVFMTEKSSSGRRFT